MIIITLAVGPHPALQCSQSRLQCLQFILGLFLIGDLSAVTQSVFRGDGVLHNFKTLGNSQCFFKPVDFSVFYILF